MDLGKQLADLFGTHASSDEDVATKHELKQIENELRSKYPLLYRNGQVQTAFADSLLLLYKYTRVVAAILSKTTHSPNAREARIYEASLFMTGFSPDMKNMYESFSYAKQREELAESDNRKQTRNVQQQNLYMFLQQIKAEEFVKIDAVIMLIQTVWKICSIDFESALVIFDQNIDTAQSDYTPAFQPVAPELLEQFLASLYNCTSGFHFTDSCARAIIALDALHRNKPVNQQQSDILLSYIKKINLLLTTVFSAETLLNLLRIANKDAQFVPEKTEIPTAVSALDAFVSATQRDFTAHAERIEEDLQNELVATKVRDMFGTRPLLELTGYNTTVNAYLRQHTSFSFLWVTPLQIFKTFLYHYFSEEIQSFCNNIIIEGFFANQVYKNKFSSCVFNCIETSKRIQFFEHDFTESGKNYTSQMYSYVKDSLRDEMFREKLGGIVNTINATARQIIQNESLQFRELYVCLNEMFADVVKNKSEHISNIRRMFTSIRNRDGAESCKAALPKWDSFFELLQIYSETASA